MAFQLGVCRVLFDFVDAEQEFDMGLSKIIRNVLEGDFGDSANQAFWRLSQRLSDRDVVE